MVKVRTQKAFKLCCIPCPMTQAGLEQRLEQDYAHQDIKKGGVLPNIYHWGKEQFKGFSLPKSLYKISLLVSATSLLFSGCGRGDYQQIRIDSIPGEESIHQIYFRPPLNADVECVTQGIGEYFRELDDNSTRSYSFVVKPDKRLGAVVVAPKELGEKYEERIRKIAVVCQAQ